MKTHALVFYFLLIILAVSSCNSGPVITKSTGLAYEIVVVMDKADWDSETGQMLKAQLTSPVPGLSQEEPSLKISYSTPKVFDGLLTYVRNILIVKIDKNVYSKVSLSYKKNRWASGQYVLELKAPDTTALKEYLTANKRTIVDFFLKAETNRTIAFLEEKHSSVVLEKVKNKFDVEIYVPEQMVYYKDTTDFFWTTNNEARGRTDIVIYTFPYTDPNTFTLEYLVAKRDSVMKANLPGSFPNSYMATEKKFGLTYSATTLLKGKYCGVMRGLWQMEGDMMGGPFVSHTRLDEKNNRVVVAEGFVYEPQVGNRNYILRAEAAILTLRLPGEFTDSTEEPLSITKDKE